MALLIACAHWLRPRLWSSRRERLATREDANGRALLRLARDIDTHALALQRQGQPWEQQRQWSALCRRVAIEHLACINALLLDADTGASLVRDGLATSEAAGLRRADAARSNRAPQ